MSRSGQLFAGGGRIEFEHVEDSSFGPPPEWMGPELRARYPPPPEELFLPDVEWPSHVACELWAQMTGPRVGAAVTAAPGIAVVLGRGAGYIPALPCTNCPAAHTDSQRTRRLPLLRPLRARL